MSSGFYGHAFAAAGYTLLAAVQLRAGAGRLWASEASPLFTAAVIASAAWGWVALAVDVGALHPLAAVVVDWLRYALLLAFVWRLALPRVAAAARARRDRRLAITGAVLLAATLLLALSAFAAAPGARRWEAMGWLSLSVFGLLLVEQLFRNVPDDYRWQANPLCVALSTLFGYDIFLFSDAVLFAGHDADSLAVRGFVHALAVPLFLLAARRQGGWASSLHVSRNAAFHTASLLLVGGYLILVSAVSYYIRDHGGDLGRALQLATVAVAIVVLAGLMLSGTVRSRVNVFIGKHFFRYRFDYRAEWLRFTAALADKGSPSETGASIVRGLAAMLDCKAGALWARSNGEPRLAPSARWNLPPFGTDEPLDGSLCRFLLDSGWIIDLDEYRARRDRYAGLELPQWLSSSPRAWLVIPLIVDDELTGFVVLARSDRPLPVNWEVRDLLKTASRQAAGFLARIQATEALLEARKFDAFSRMSAFVVHDLKNIVTQLSLMLSNAKRLQNNPQFREDMLQTVENSLDKMRQLILQLREGEAPTGGSSGVDLVPVVKRLEAMSSASGRTLRLEIVEPVATRGHEERISRVLGHLVHNAFDATPPDGHVWLRLDRASGQARIQVGDSGHGMSEEFIRTRLFKPFNTTKPNGMGIGAYESLHYVQQLGGRIEVDSEEQRGTVVTVLLPVLETRSTTDLLTAIDSK